jgi:AAA15 family ATPase/GTPase
MLIRLTLKNWMSFQDTTIFSMVSGGERHHRARVPRLGSRFRVLPASLIYGANASGKSNFFQAFKFARDLILTPPRQDGVIPVLPFLTPEENTEPTDMAFSIFSGKKIYEYFFSVTRRKVLREKLSLILFDKREQVLFDLDRGKKLARNQNSVKFPCAGKNVRENDRLNFLLEGTQEHQLFLNNAHSQRMKVFEDAVSWFKRLTLISPEASYRYLQGQQDKNTDFESLSEYLKALDTGVEGFILEEKEITREELQLLIDPSLKNDFLKNVDALKDGENVYLTDEDTEIFPLGALMKKNGGFVLKRLNTTRSDHRTGKEIKNWDLSLESDGTKRVINLLPMLLDARQEHCDRVHVIDELERSLHPNMARWLMENFLGSCSEKTRFQLIATTHDVMLMDQKLLRRDEIWVVERGASSNVSKMFPLSDYKALRDDTDIRKHYLLGALGGAPKILPCTETVHREYRPRSSCAGA